MKVFWDKTADGVEERDNEAIRIGNDLEQYVAVRFMEATRLKVGVAIICTAARGIRI